MTKIFSPGTKVMSNAAGCYMGSLGTIINRASIQYNMDIRYVIQLDLGKRIVLNSSCIKPIVNEKSWR